jgi:Fur family ferric uptake transcriptional regulator
MQEHPHHHLVCERCGNVSHIHDAVLGDYSKRIRDTAGFTIGNREITLFGLCNTCSAS